MGPSPELNWGPWGICSDVTLMCYIRTLLLWLLYIIHSLPLPPFVLTILPKSKQIKNNELHLQMNLLRLKERKSSDMSNHTANLGPFPSPLLQPHSLVASSSANTSLLPRWFRSTWGCPGPISPSLLQTLTVLIWAPTLCLSKMSSLEYSSISVDSQRHKDGSCFWSVVGEGKVEAMEGPCDKRKNVARCPSSPPSLK